MTPPKEALFPAKSGYYPLARVLGTPAPSARSQNLTHSMKLTSLLIAGSLMIALSGFAADDIISGVMKEGFKGKEAIAAKIGKGEASEAEQKKMADLVAKLTGAKPPKGEAKAFADKVGKLNEAAQALVSKKAGAVDLWKAASNCKACHTDHKSDDKK